MPHNQTSASFTLDRDLRFLSANEAFFAATGLTREQVIGRLYLEIWPGAEGSPGHQTMLKALSTLQPQRVRIFSTPLQVHLDCEGFVVGEHLHVVFRQVDPPEDA